MYASLQELRERFDLGDCKDLVLRRALRAASAAVDDYCSDHPGQRVFADPNEDAQRVFHPYLQPIDGAYVLEVDDLADVPSLVEESSDQGQTWTEVAAHWWATPLNAGPKTALAKGTPWAPWVRVTGRYWFGSTPDAVVEATLLRAAAIFLRRQTPTGMAFGGEFGPIRITRFEDPDVVRLLDPLSRRLPGIA